MISKEQIQEVKERTDIVALINSYVPLKKAGGSHKACCPFHNEKSPSFNVNAQRQFYHCFGCGVHGGAINFVMDYEGVDFPEAVRILARNANITLIENSSPQQQAKARQLKAGKDRLFQLMEKLTVWFTSQMYQGDGSLALNYLRNRGVDDETMRRFCLGYAPDSWDATKKWAQNYGFSLQDLFDAGLLIIPEGKNIGNGYDRFRGRLMFPIWNEYGNIVGFSARTLKDESAKYINSPDTIIFNKSKLLYALPLAKAGIRALKTAIICEGQLDVIACHRAGLTNAVAPQGTAFTEDQARLLARFTDKVLVCFDSDSAGQKAAVRSQQSLSAAGLDMAIVSLPEGEDPDGVFKKSGAEGLQACFEKQQDFFDFQIQSYNQTEFSSDKERSEAISTILNTIAALPDPITRQLRIQKLAFGVSIPAGILNSELSKLIAALHRQQNFSGNQSVQASPVAQRPNRMLNKFQMAKLTLLDLALHHGYVAHYLLDNATNDFFVGDTCGAMLNELIGHTSQGEWAIAGQILTEDFKGRIPHEICNVLVKSEYEHLLDESEENKKRIDQVVTDCLLVLKLPMLERKEQELWQQFKAETDPNRKRELFALQRQMLDQKMQAKAQLRSQVDPTQ